MTTFQKTIKYAALGFAACLTIFVVTVIFDTLSNVFDGISNPDDYAVSDTYTYENIDSIDVELGLGSMIIRSEGDTFIVNANDALGLTIKERDGTLYIETGTSLWGSGSDCSIEVIVPADFVLTSLNLEVGAGKCTVDNIHTKNGDFEVGVGSLVGNGLTIEKGKIDSGIGAVELSFANNIETYSITLDKGLGSAKLNGSKYNEDKHKNSSAEYTLNIDCGIGDIDLDFAD